MLTLLALHAVEIPDWRDWSIHWSVVVGILVTAWLYVRLGGLQAPRRRVAAFAGSLVVLFLSLNGPLHNLSDEYLFSAHMVQHLLLTLLFPPLFLYGLGADTVRRVLEVLNTRWSMEVFAFVTRPIPAAVLFLIPMTAWHVPRFYETAMRNHDIHIAQHLTFLVTSVLMWWPVLSPVPELPRASYPVQMLYLFLLGIPLTLVGALITLSGEVLYPFYAEAALRVWDLSPLTDQQLGGLIMWVPGGLLFWLVMTVVWFRWSARSEQGGDPDRAVPLEAYR